MNKADLTKIKNGQYSYKGTLIVFGQVSTHRGQGWYYMNPKTFKTMYASSLKDATSAVDYALELKAGE